ncbi:MAG: hypothetical protein EOR86_13375 [Mesorhizobium sp.]|uniref:hypothetical protein n=1 Tax=Mesorhizobium sp. TaxID=1871066 RepID=UPI000FE7C7A7|nr:hypothetical protein [Mesorhizobium sp.]RWM96194.1 MAG: hypothetical protein EOR86_13375 [Mesorhizobium sp.]
MAGAIRKFSVDQPVRRVNVLWQSAYGQCRRDVSYMVADDKFDDEGDLLPIIDDEPWRMVDHRSYVRDADIDEIIPNSGRHIQ